MMGCGWASEGTCYDNVGEEPMEEPLSSLLCRRLRALIKVVLVSRSMPLLCQDSMRRFSSGGEGGSGDLRGAQDDGGEIEPIAQSDMKALVFHVSVEQSEAILKTKTRLRRGGVRWCGTCRARTWSPPWRAFGFDDAATLEVGSYIIKSTKRRKGKMVRRVRSIRRWTAGPMNPRPVNTRALALDHEVLILHEIDRPVAERMIRDKLGNNPDTSKSLRRLVMEGKVVRHGAGYVSHVGPGSGGGWVEGQSTFLIPSTWFLAFPL